jgi:hypothetical protein
MDTFQYWQQIDQLMAERLDLEHQAGIAAAMMRAREEPSMPDAGEASAPHDPYRTGEPQRQRERTRAAYFSVEDAALRKALITLARAERGLRLQALSAEVVAAETAFAGAIGRMQLKGWLRGALALCAATAAGYTFFALHGALAGAVCGFVLARVLAADVKARAAHEVANAADAVEFARQREAGALLAPEVFTQWEESRGERDRTGTRTPILRTS